MTQRMAILAAAGITAFVLVVLGGVVARSTAGAVHEATVAPVPVQVQAQAPVPSDPVVAAAPAPDYPISLSDAAAIAAPLVPGARLTRAPELVDYQGVAAYEFATDRGLIYVDATTGQVLYNGAQTVQAGAAGDDEHEHDEHEESGDDD